MLGRAGQRGWYERAERWRKGVESGTEIDVPPEVFKESGECRVRACRSTGTANR